MKLLTLLAILGGKGHAGAFMLASINHTQITNGADRSIRIEPVGGQVCVTIDPMLEQWLEMSRRVSIAWGIAKYHIESGRLVGHAES